MSRPLAGRAVLITRPAGLAKRLAALVEAAGGEPIEWPTIEILPPEDPERLAAVLARLEEFDTAIFISPSAVASAHRALAGRGGLPSGIAAAAIGAGTDRALREAGVAQVIAPQGRGDSEALAALPEFADLRSRNIVIFRGQGGRETLRDALKARGARVEYAECYRRGIPRTDPGPLVRRWRERGIDAVSVTSSEGLENLASMLGQEHTELLRAAPVFVPHPRIGAAARRFGVARVVLTGARDDALVEAIGAFFAKV